MANTLQGNVHYIDAIGVLKASTEQNVKVCAIIVTATAANAILVLSDPSDVNLLELRVATSGDSRLFDFVSNNLQFPKGLKCKTLTNATAAVIYIRNNSDGG